tara:strand:+ start:57 stop:488 length:432 start_codon:yes stop_codon:yes gene_type:complete
MKTVENGNNVLVHYKGTFSDGEVFDDSRERGGAMDVLVGNGNFLQGFESALLGMSEGEIKTVNLGASEAYGPVVPEAIVVAPKTAFPEDFPFEEGITVTGNGPNGEVTMARIVSFTDTDVTLDHNHPLAGRDLNFEIELLEIQ